MLSTPRRKSERGAAALEFALITPAALVLFGGMLSFGFAQLTQLALFSTLQSTVRFCAAAESSTSSNPVADVSACVSTTMQRTAATTMLKSLCDLDAPTASVTQTQLFVDSQSTAPIARPTYLLGAQAQCRRSYFRFINFYGLNLPAATLHAKSAVPFTP